MFNVFSVSANSKIAIKHQAIVNRTHTDSILDAPLKGANIRGAGLLGDDGNGVVGLFTQQSQSGQRTQVVDIGFGRAVDTRASMISRAACVRRRKSTSHSNRSDKSRLRLTMRTSSSFSRSTSPLRKATSSCSFLISLVESVAFSR